jgi:hypothetical protein
MTDEPHKRAPRKKPLAERLNRELSERGGGSIADERSELLRDQARARGVEHRRRVALREAAQAVVVDPPAAPPVAPPAPDRALSRLERHEAEELAQNRRTVWLPEPIVIPGTQRRVFAYDPENVPPWLAEILAEQVAA